MASNGTETVAANDVAFDGQVSIVIVQEQSSYREVVDVVNVLFWEGDCE